jgi:hypothetical protein
MLKSIKYYVNATSNNDPWSLERIDFDYFNLIAGINSTGKSRMIKVINGLALFIRNSGTRYVGIWNAIFEFDNDIYDYEINCHSNGSISELLYINKVEILKREDDFVEMFSEVTGKNEIFSPPSNSLVVHVRRDQKAYPYLEKLYNWANNVKFFEFGHLHSYEFTSITSTKNESISIDNIAKILLENVSKDGVKNVIFHFNKLGYDLVDLTADTIKGVPKILVKERGFVNFIEQNMMSQGMLRSIALLIFIEYIKESGKDHLILIDDLAEGLDYKRATLLGDHLNVIAEPPMQFISTSNHDYFLNETSIENWIILYRNGIEVKSISSKKYPDVFKKFKMSGLAPFDLFTSNFLNKYIKDEDINIR